VFGALKGTLVPGSEVERYADVAAELGTSEGAVKVAAHRLRARYAQDIRAEIASTLADPSEVDLELAALFAALGE
jgi:RNA polymerase sigma-70 factor (ECF subfamily)